MNTDYGQQIALALAAVEQLFADSSKLLQDCDKTIGRGRDSLFGNEVTRELSKALNSPGIWMPTALYRYYDYGHVRPGLVTGLCICFRDEPGVDPARIKEPILIVGQLQFKTQKAVPPRGTFPMWALWNGYFVWTEERSFQKVIVHQENAGEGSYLMKFVVAPLYSIKLISDVEQLLEQLTDVTSDAHSGQSPEQL